MAESTYVGFRPFMLLVYVYFMVFFLCLDRWSRAVEE